MVGVKDWVVKYFIWLIENLDSENLGSDLERWRRKIMVRNIGIRKKKIELIVGFYFTLPPSLVRCFQAA